MIQVSVKSKKTGNIRTLLVFKMCQRGVIYDMKIKYEMKFSDLKILIEKIESSVLQIYASDSYKIDIKTLDKCYILKSKVKKFDISKHQTLRENETNWNTLYEKYMKGRIYGSLENFERSIFEERLFEKQTMIDFFECQEWFASNKSVQDFKKSIKQVKSFLDAKDAGIKTEKPKFPDYWNEAYVKAANLTPQEVMDYRSYLMSKGHTPIYSTQNKSKIIGYMKPVSKD